MFAWTPGEAQGPGQYLFSVRVSDGLAFAEQSISVTVNEVNAAPLLSVPATVTGDEMTGIAFTASAIDGDVPAQTLQLSFDDVPSGAVIDASSGKFSWTPTEAQGPGSYTFTVRVFDGVDSTADSVTITVGEVNCAPVAEGVPSETAIDELVPFTFDAAALDDDVPPHDQTLTFSLVGCPSGATISPSGHFDWTPGEAQGPGSYPFTVRVSDGVSHTDTAITITVNETNSAPLLSAIGSKATTWGTPVTFTASATDPDQPPNVLTYSLTGKADGMWIDPVTGAFSWTPTSLQVGPATVTVNASDGSTTDSETISISVGRRTPVIAYSGATSGQYSDPSHLTALLHDPGNSAGIEDDVPVASGTVRFTLGTLIVDATILDGVAVTDAPLTQAPGASTVFVSFFGSDLYNAVSISSPYLITAEDARSSYAGTLYAASACVTCTQAVVTLAATVRDVKAVIGDPAWDDSGGDIRNATVTFVDLDTMTDIATAPVDLIATGDLLTGLASHDWTIDLGAADDMEITIGIRVGGSYTATLTAETVVTVVKPLPNSISGSGYILLSDSTGLLRGDDGSKNNFGFGLRYNKNGRSLQGRINTLFRATGDDGVQRTYRAKATALTSLAVKAEEGTATFTAKAVLQDLTRPLSPEAVDGNVTVQVTITDAGNPGTSDSIGITILKKKGGLWFSSSWDGTRTAEKALEAGNLKIH